MAGVALGCLIVGINYTLTIFVVSRALRETSLKGQVLFAFSFKFGLTVVALYLAILHFGVDPLSILLGVTSLVAASLVLVLGFPPALRKSSASAVAKRVPGRFRP